MSRELTIEEVRAIQISILRKVHDYCEDKGLRYSLSGGSLLGAIRHQGFIPWDDDIDIMLPRPDYDLFIKGFGKVRETLTLQNFYNDEGYYLMFSKIYDNRTVYIQNGYRGGVFIDVFPIDGLPALQEYKKYLQDLKYIKDQIWRATKTYKFSNNKPISFIKYCLRQFVYRFPNKAKLIKEYESFYQHYNFETSDYSGVALGSYGLKEILPSSVFKEYTLLPFEGYYFSCIKQYNTYLKSLYGDYMKLPPKEQRVPHHIEHIFWKE